MEKKEAELRRFLRERGLTRSYSEYRKLPRRRVSTEITVDDFERGSRRQRLIITREKGYTRIRDFSTLKVIGRSRQPINDVIKSFDKTKKEKRSFNLKVNGRDWSIRNERKIKAVHLKNESKITSFNKVLGRLTEITMTNDPRKYSTVRGHRVKTEGFAVVDAVYVSASGQIARVQSRSKGGFHIGTKRGQDDAVADALHNGSVMVKFSPVDVVVKDFWFEVFKYKYIDMRAK